MGTSRRFYRPERLGALTDRVFAIALTLLILNLKLPDPPRAAVTCRDPVDGLALFTGLVA